MTEVDRSRSARLNRIVSTVVLVGAALTAATFVIAVVGLYVPGMGRNNMGAALVLAFLAQLAGSTSTFLAAAACGGAAFARWQGWPARRWVAAFGLSLTPSLLLLWLDAAPF
jgi:hypothetical protein